MLSCIASRLFGKSAWKSGASRLAALVGARDANVSVMTAVGLIPLITAVGVATDSALAFMVKTRMQAAVDAAALAGGRVIYADQTTSVAREFFDLNFPPGYLSSSVTSFALSKDEETGIVALDAEASVPTVFMHLVNIDAVTVTARTVVEAESRGMELALIMDNTGSMRSGNKIGAMRESAKDLVNILYGPSESLEHVWMSVIPYAATVNIGSDRTNWLAADDRVNTGYGKRFPDLGAPISYIRLYVHNSSGSWRRHKIDEFPEMIGEVTDLDTLPMMRFVHDRWDDDRLIAVGAVTASGDDDDDGEEQVFILDDEYELGDIPTGESTTETESYSAAFGAYSMGYWPTTWKGCVEARTPPYDQNDALPSAEPFTSYFYEPEVDNDWSTDVDERNSAQNDGYGPNLGCPPEISPLLTTKTEVIAAIDEMEPWHRGGTLSNLGMVWGWRTLSPNWRGMWAGGDLADLPLDYDHEEVDKVAILLTDGDNVFYDWPNHDGPDGGSGPRGSDYNAYGRLEDTGQSKSNARNGYDNRLAATCELMKNEGITIFTITFGSSPDSQTQSLYRNCASKEEGYHHAPNNDALGASFRSIGQALNRLRIVE